MKKTTLQEVKGGLFISMTPKEKFDYDSQRIQDNCQKILDSIPNWNDMYNEKFVRKVENSKLEFWNMSESPGIGNTTFHVTLNKDWFAK